MARNWIDELFTTESVREVRKAMTHPWMKEGPDWLTQGYGEASVFTYRMSDTLNAPIALELLKTGADINNTNNLWGNTPLLFTISNGVSTNALWLIKNGKPFGLNPDVQDHYPHPEGGFTRNTALTLSIAKGYEHQVPPGKNERRLFGMLKGKKERPLGQVADALLDMGANPDIQIHNGNTAAHIAFLRHDLTAIEALAKHGARFDIPNDDGKLPGDMLDVPYEEARRHIGNLTGGQCTFPDKARWENTADLQRIRKIHDDQRRSQGKLPPVMPPEEHRSQVLEEAKEYIRQMPEGRKLKLASQALRDTGLLKGNVKFDDYFGAYVTPKNPTLSPEEILAGESTLFHNYARAALLVRIFEETVGSLDEFKERCIAQFGDTPGLLDEPAKAKEAHSTPPAEGPSAVSRIKPLERRPRRSTDPGSKDIQERPGMGGLGKGSGDS